MITKLIEVQKLLKAPKNQYNSFGDYHYRSCEDILEAVKPLLAERGLLLTITDSVELIGERYYVKATAKITDGTNTYEASAYARETFERKKMDDAQLTGSASTYARKYALNGLLCIDDAKDADGLPSEAKTESKTKTDIKQFNGSKAYYELKGEAEKGGITQNELNDYLKNTFKIGNASQMTADQFRIASEWIDSEIKKKKA